MIAYVQDGLVISQPGPATETWQDPATGISESCFRNFSWGRMYAAGWREVIDVPLVYDAAYQQSSVSNWRYDGGMDKVTRDYTISDRPMESVRAERLAAVQEECRARILAVISIEHQMDVALGIDPDLGYTAFIAAMRAASDRCEDLYTSAGNMADLRAVAWDFPVYSWEGIGNGASF